MFCNVYMHKWGKGGDTVPYQYPIVLSGPCRYTYIHICVCVYVCMSGLEREAIIEILFTSAYLQHTYVCTYLSLFPEGKYVHGRTSLTIDYYMAANCPN